MYWSLILLGVTVWVLATGSGISEPEVPDRRPIERLTLSVRWSSATPVERAGLAALTIGRIAWTGVIVLTFVIVVIGAATWMY